MTTVTRLDTSPVRRAISRPMFLQVVKAALKRGSYRFARQATLDWLTIYSGDLEVSRLLALALHAGGSPAEAISMLERICMLDPEFVDAQENLALLSEGADLDTAVSAYACAYALGREISSKVALPAWAVTLRQAHRALTSGLIQEAEELIYQVLGLNLDVALPAVVHLNISRQKDDASTVHRLASIYHSRWQDCLQFGLTLAQSQLDLQCETNTVELLHHCVANDAAGQVAVRLWGNVHRFKSLWHDRMEIDLGLPIPAAVASELGWNRLAGGSPVDVANEDDVISEVLQSKAPEVIPVEDAVRHEAVAEVPRQTAEVETPTDVLENKPALNAPPPPPESPFATAQSVASSSQGVEARRSPDERGGVIPVEKPPRQKKSSRFHTIEREFERLAKKLKQPELVDSDGRFPIYIVFSTRAGLVRQYGQQSALVLEDAMKKLAEVVRNRPGWGAMVFLPDELEYTQHVGVETLAEIDPWKLKLSLVDLDHSLAKKGAMIGALLIVGGPQVVPFHSLPNPTEDVDEHVLSDNPYATLDSNYFVPEWQVGRLPGEEGPDAGLLLEQIRRLHTYHARFKRTDLWWRRLFAAFQFATRLEQIGRRLVGRKSLPSLGYTAEVWRRASLAAFRPVGEGRSLLVSPPVVSGKLEPKKITDTSLGYYNLHGLPDTAEWYGQRDMTSPAKGPDYPVALSVKDLVKNGRAPQIVFTEACYGGHILSKSEQQALALRFIAIGTQGVVGSTCISYGSITTPLIGADLLCYLFWKYLNEGFTAGEALLKAKVDMAKEMNRRQGFLDGEDQKTLISFVLYGDPLVQRSDQATRRKGISRPLDHPLIPTICDRQETNSIPEIVSRDVLREVKQMVEAYLPGLEEAEVVVSQERSHCDGNTHSCPTAQMNGKTQSTRDSERVVVTISKKVRVAQSVHRHYARATLNSQGKLVKLAVSR